MWKYCEQLVIVLVDYFILVDKNQVKDRMIYYSDEVMLKKYISKKMIVQGVGFDVLYFIKLLEL